MFRRESKPQNRIDSLIGATTRIEGNVFFSGGLRVDGAVRGMSRGFRPPALCGIRTGRVSMASTSAPCSTAHHGRDAPRRSNFSRIACQVHTLQEHRDQPAR